MQNCMKRIDDTTLEAIAELVCGGGQGSGGGYTSPGTYRSMGEILGFFERAGVELHGQSGTRKWRVLESLQSINGSSDLRKVLVRLASPKEYRGDSHVFQQVIGHLNRSLQVEGLEIRLTGVEPYLQEREASVSPPRPDVTPTENAPDFRNMVNDPALSEILTLRWQEAQACVNAEAYLAAVGPDQMGSILEGLLLRAMGLKLECHPPTSRCPNQATTSGLEDRNYLGGGAGQGKARGVQTETFTASGILARHGVKISMDGKGRY